MWFHVFLHCNHIHIGQTIYWLSLRTGAGQPCRPLLDSNILAGYLKEGVISKGYMACHLWAHQNKCVQSSDTLQDSVMSSICS